jgi:alkylation response protein AidB-like acyl-CoA dehydrogenase
VLTGLTGAATAIGAPPIIAFGTEAQKQAWLPGIFTGETSFCLGATEPSGGSDLANLRTTAKKTPDGKHYIVNGTKVGAFSISVARSDLVSGEQSLTVADRNGSLALWSRRI